ncbi:DUF732 domain-containing protein [Rhodococcus sp. G-MC3]|uniref:DUF732 domain-containing protein n=1 Tax=Rhodococcus sp. G-MC3 TaxID=3046209 RepID=UPI0024B8815F|nr:DUF732 domain-containing protein [Rhodococcus sp. G-MC3]MDJ0395456.1 DUF732 domain-containing protein [Rhodococcus sp. G-MC3]
MSNIRQFLPIALASLALTAACGGSSGGVTDAEAEQFATEMNRANIVGHDNEAIVKAVCDDPTRGSKNGSNVGNVVAAYLGVDINTGGAEVDNVVALAIQTACPEYASDYDVTLPKTVASMVAVPIEAIDDFVAQMRERGFTQPDQEISFVVTNTCRLAGTGQNYGELSSGVAQLLNLPSGGGDVDDVMSLIFDLGCPEARP